VVWVSFKVRDISMANLFPTLIIQLFRFPLNYWYPLSEHLTAGHDCKYAIAYEKAHRTKNPPNRKKKTVCESDINTVFVPFSHNTQIEQQPCFYLLSRAIPQLH